MLSRAPGLGAPGTSVILKREAIIPSNAALQKIW